MTLCRRSIRAVRYAVVPDPSITIPSRKPSGPPRQLGIVVENGSTENVLIGNQARGNLGTDLVDDNVNCDLNQWQNNGFDTRNQACIQ